MILGAAAIAADRIPAAAARAEAVWILYPTTLPSDARWLPIAWIALGVLGTAVQLRITGRKK